MLLDTVLQSLTHASAIAPLAAFLAALHSVLCTATSALHSALPPSTRYPTNATPAEVSSDNTPPLMSAGSDVLPQHTLRRIVVEVLDTCAHRVHSAIGALCEEADREHPCHEALCVMPALPGLPPAGGAVKNAQKLCAALMVHSSAIALLARTCQTSGVHIISHATSHRLQPC